MFTVSVATIDPSSNAKLKVLNDTVHESIWTTGDAAYPHPFYPPFPISGFFLPKIRVHFNETKTRTTAVL